ncbi:MAG TPA: hypothetical protein VH414_21540 [Lichenihabitans sp.]|jgi:hypothetical protein|nr:hypothetical protein [Lichenihabitans sp.]
MPDVNTVIEQAVRTSLAPVDVASVHIVLGHDVDDDEAIFVTVNLPPSTPLVGGEKYLEAMASVSAALLQMGDKRYPYVSLHYEGELDADEGGRSGERSQ